MKTNTNLHFHQPGKLFVKLTIFGCFLIGFVYAFLLLFNIAVKAFQ